MSVRIFAMTHKRFEVPNDPMYIPMHVGHASAKEELGYLGDRGSYFEFKLLLCGIIRRVLGVEKFSPCGLCGNLSLSTFFNKRGGICFF